MSVAIGQGYNLATPIQMARVVAAIANGGIIYKTHIVEKVESPAGEILYQAKPRYTPAWRPARPPWRRCAGVWRAPCQRTQRHGQSRPSL